MKYNDDKNEYDDEYDYDGTDDNGGIDNESMDEYDHPLMQVWGWHW